MRMLEEDDRVIARTRQESQAVQPCGEAAESTLPALKGPCEVQMFSK